MPNYVCKKLLFQLHSVMFDIHCAGLFLAHLRRLTLSIPTHQQFKAIDSNKALLDSIFSQMEHHILQQTILLHQQKREIIRLKREPYIASIRERTAELALLNVIKHKDMLKRQLHMQEQTTSPTNDESEHSDSELDPLTMGTESNM